MDMGKTPASLLNKMMTAQNYLQWASIKLIFFVINLILRLL